MAKQTIRISPFQGNDGKYRIRLQYTNGNILSSTPDYSTKWNAKRAAKRLHKLTGLDIDVDAFRVVGIKFG